MGDERLQLFDQHLAIGVGVTATQPTVFERRVLVDAFGSGVVDADDHHRFNFTRGDHAVGSFANPPVIAFDERGFGVEEVLAVVQIEHGKEPVGIVVKRLRDVHDEVVLFIDEVRSKLGVEVQPRMQAAVTVMVTHRGGREMGIRVQERFSRYSLVK